MVKEFNELIGKTIMRIETSNEVYSNELSGTNDIVHENRQIWFYMDDGSKFHVRIDYSITENGKTVSRYNESLLTPLKSNCILEALRGSLMRDDDGYISSFSSKCFFNLFNEFFDKKYGHCVPSPEIKFYLVP